MNINPQEGELFDMDGSLFEDGSVDMYDRVNDECARVVRGRQRIEVLKLMAEDWHAEYLTREQRDWLRELAGAQQTPYKKER